LFVLANEIEMLFILFILSEIKNRMGEFFGKSKNQLVRKNKETD
jgi:hypothetical protein